MSTVSLEEAGSKFADRHHTRRRRTLWAAQLVLLCLVFAVAVRYRYQANAHEIATLFALIHMNPQLGAVDQNIQALSRLADDALEHGAKVVVTPELATTGYSITADQVREQEGLARPFTKLNKLRDLAIKYSAFLYVGIAEVTASGKLFNSVAVFGPQGLMDVQRKRGIATWNERGDIPIDVLKTPYGNIATVICSDTYLPDWTRIAVVEAADMIVEPANWWGDYGQLGIWSARARENGVWIIVANRWGQETDSRFGSPMTYDMNDAPSAVIDPRGNVRLSHKANDSTKPGDDILYLTITVPSAHVRNPLAENQAIAYRAPEAYRDLGLPCASVTGSGSCATALPPAGKTGVALVAYTPATEAAQNISVLKNKLGNNAPQIVVLPPMGISGDTAPLNTPPSIVQEPWRSVQQLVETREILILCTTIRDKRTGRDYIVVFGKGKLPKLFASIHDAPQGPGSHSKPLMIDLPNARVGIVTGRDFEFPEIQTELALDGADIVLLTSSLGSEANSDFLRWSRASLVNAWKVAADSGFHLVAADASGFALLVENGGMYVVRTVEIGADDQAKMFFLDSVADRKRKLNLYYPFDTKVLLSAPDAHFLP